MKTNLLSFVLSLAVISAAQAQTVLYDFNTPGQLTGDLTYAQNVAGGTQQSSGGLSNSGYVEGSDFNTSQFTAVAKAAYATSTAADFTLTQSVYFKTLPTIDLGTFSGQDPVILGISDSGTQAANNQNLLINLTPNFIASTVRINNPNDSGNVVLEFKGGSNGGQFGPATTVSVAADSWFFFEVNYNYRTGPNNWLLEYTLYSSLDDGTLDTELFNLTLNGAIQANIFGADPELYGFLASDTQLSSSIQGFDNATLVGVPEPSSGALLASVGLGLAAWTRRRGARSKGA